MASEGLSITGSPVKDVKYLNNGPIYASAILQSIKNGLAVHDTNAITNWSFFGGTFSKQFIDKHCCDEFKSVIKELDKSLINSESTQKAIGSAFDCKFHTNKTGELIMTASKDTIKTRTGKAIANTLGTTTRFGLLAAGAVEAPNLYTAYKNGDFGKQTVRSTANIASTTVAFGVAAHLFKQYAPTRLKPVFMLAGVIGSILAGKTTENVMDKAIGKSIEKQKQEVLAKHKEVKEKRTAVS